MSIPDDLMREWFDLLTDLPAEVIATLTDGAKTHPMEAKKTLAKDIVSFYHGIQAADEANVEWNKRFSQRQDPSEIPEKPIARTELTDGKIALAKLLVLLGLAKSNNDARRLIQGGGVTLGLDKSKASDPAENVEVTDGLIVRVGSKRVVKVRLK
jgi:tyrosyl-tRNA synthetase